MSGEVLDVTSLPLNGRHLIEASAGTGKTYNITRLYLRLLIEKRLSVQQILVMTFTNAATQEIRGRIADTLREAKQFWHKQIHADSLLDAEPLFCRLYTQCPAEEGLALLDAALLELDEASVFTIHGFCNRVLTQLAFDSGTPMSLSLATETREYYQTAVEDWIRLQSQNEPAFHLLAERGWHIPEQFINVFASALYSSLTADVADEVELERDYNAQRQALALQFAANKQAELKTLKENQGMVFDSLINNQKTGAKQAERVEEWECILQWLSSDSIEAAPKQVGAFINGNRYRGNKAIGDVFAGLKALKSQVQEACTKLESQRQNSLDSIPALNLVCQGITFVKQHVEKQKRRLGLLGFDDLINRLAAQIKNGGSELITELRKLYPVAMIDEFQDTDQNQYQIFETLYPAKSEDQVLLMIGDPKQAIYGFRGGDIFTYLEAGKNADYRWVMDTNWRSVASMVNAYNRLFFGAPLDTQARDVFGYGIGYEPVLATDKAKAATIRLVDNHSRYQALTFLTSFDQSDESPAKDVLQSRLCDGVCKEILRLFGEAMLGGRSVRPADIAILVRSGAEAFKMQRALKKFGLSAVFLSDKRSLFESEEAIDLLRVLRGIWHANDPRRLASALRSPLFGLSNHQFVDIFHHDDEKGWEAMLALLQHLKEVWMQQGVMAMILELIQRHYQQSSQDIERSLTNYLHLSEVLEHACAGHPQPEQLVLWLHRQIEYPEGNDALVQRLESDAQLIQIVTQHGSKGLEYPIVFVPFASDYRDPAKSGQSLSLVNQFYHPVQKRLCMTLGQSFASAEQVRQQGDAEAMRLLYVAITRAAYRCYLGVANFNQSERSSLALALALTEESKWHKRLAAYCDEQFSDSAMVSIDSIIHREIPLPTSEESEPLVVAQFDRDIDDKWRLYSFSALTRQKQSVIQTRREEEWSVEQSGDISPDNPDSSVGEFRFEFVKGATAGNLLHDLLEHSDFEQTNWQETGVSLTERFGLDETQYRKLFDWMNEVLETPLGLPGCAAFSLSQLSPNQVLKEAEFYFPMKLVSWYNVADILKQHRESLLHLTGNAEPVPKLSSNILEGMMHGFIDLIFECKGKFYVADYKSTHLGDRFTDYAHACLAVNIQHHLYDLQYLIYSLALHRYLKNRLPDYDPTRHFGGVVYCYLRGMATSNTLNEGVFFTALSTTTLDALDTAFGVVSEGESI